MNRSDASWAIFYAAYDLRINSFLNGLGLSLVFRERFEAESENIYGKSLPSLFLEKGCLLDGP